VNQLVWIEVLMGVSSIVLIANHPGPELLQKPAAGRNWTFLSR
jgi:hypothetical protein